jgi:hypothetical protein
VGAARFGVICTLMMVMRWRWMGVVDMEWSGGLAAAILG